MATATIEAHEVFRFLRPDQVRTLSDAAEPVPFRAGETIYDRGEQADYLYIVLSGQVTLLLRAARGVSLVVDRLGEGALFGTCVCVDLPTYNLTAQCSEDCELLKVEAAVLKKLMENDLPMGYAIQTQTARTYFMRYVETVSRLQSVLVGLPLQPQ